MRVWRARPLLRLVIALPLSGLLASPALCQEVVLHSFAEGGPYEPRCALLQASDGNFYGTTAFGGDYNEGTLFRLTPSGALTILHNFSGASIDGALPQSGLAQASDGNLYGTTRDGGAFGFGCVYSFSLAGNFSLLYSFTGGSDGSAPNAAPVQDSSDLNLYGTTSLGGQYAGGTIYQLSLGGSFRALYSFGGTSSDGVNPTDALAQATDGNLYGVTHLGGVDDAGTMYSISPSGLYTQVYSFASADPAGNMPGGALVQVGGSLYGAAAAGGAFGHGSVYRMPLGGSVSALYSFTGGADGQSPSSGLVVGSDGNLYGASSGTLFQLSTSGSLTVLHTFLGAPADGSSPVAPPIQASDGDLYGTTSAGGLINRGVVYQATTAGGYSVFLDLSSGSPDGAYCSSALTATPNGSLLGAASAGGAWDAGALFKVASDGSESLLHSFAGGRNDGAGASAGLELASDGNYYGCTGAGGAHNLGTVFRMSQAGKVTVIHSFSGSDGAAPAAAPVEAADGNLYGTTSAGGKSGLGVVYRISLAGKFSVLHTFDVSSGASPYSGLLAASDGNLYGTTEAGGSAGDGVVFSMSTSGSYSVVHVFTGPDGSGPTGASLIQATNGALYGTTFAGGASGVGTLFSLTTAGVYSLLYSFAGSPADGANPQSGLIQGSDGYLYGVTSLGGSSNLGTAFRADTSGNVVLLHSFAGEFSDGSQPAAPLAEGLNANLYGTTDQGGEYGVGSIFELQEGLPVLAATSVSPRTVFAGGPAVTISVAGLGFAAGDTVSWNGSPLSTTYVSGTSLNAVVPSIFTAAPGVGSVSVGTPAGGESNSVWFVVGFTAVKPVSAMLSRDPNTGDITAVITLKNTEYLSAPQLEVTSSTLNKVKTSSLLPALAGDLAGGATTTVSLVYPSGAGTTGSKVTLSVSGKFTGGKFSGSLKVTLP